MKILVSVATYELSKRVGNQRAAREFNEQCSTPRKESLPAARLIHRLGQLVGGVTLYHCAGSCLPKLRSRAFGAALRSGAEYWLMVDDDVECDSNTLASMLEVAGLPGDRRAVVLPCVLRGGSKSVNVVLDPEGLIQQRHATSSGAVYTRRALRAGTGAMILTRGAIEALKDASDDLRFKDEDGSEQWAVFAMLLNDGNWFSEDYSFTARLKPAGVELLALLTGYSSHDGAVLDLSTI
jgi:hypothetical protein